MVIEEVKDYDGKGGPVLFLLDNISEDLRRSSYLAQNFPKLWEALQGKKLENYVEFDDCSGIKDYGGKGGPVVYLLDNIPEDLRRSSYLAQNFPNLWEALQGKKLENYIVFDDEEQHTFPNGESVSSNVINLPVLDSIDDTSPIGFDSYSFYEELNALDVVESIGTPSLDGRQYRGLFKREKLDRSEIRGVISNVLGISELSVDKPLVTNDAVKVGPRSSSPKRKGSKIERKPGVRTVTRKITSEERIARDEKLRRLRKGARGVVSLDSASENKDIKREIDGLDGIVLGSSQHGFAVENGGIITSLEKRYKNKLEFFSAKLNDVSFEIPVEVLAEVYYSHKISRVYSFMGTTLGEYDVESKKFVIDDERTKIEMDKVKKNLPLMVILYSNLRYGVYVRSGEYEYYEKVGSSKKGIDALISEFSKDDERFLRPNYITYFFHNSRRSSFYNKDDFLIKDLGLGTRGQKMGKIVGRIINA